MLMFTKSEVSRFVHRNKALRWGQAFHRFMKLEKVQGHDRDFCDKLYNATDEIAKQMVASRTDRTQ